MSLLLVRSPELVEVAWACSFARRIVDIPRPVQRTCDLAADLTQFPDVSHVVRVGYIGCAYTLVVSKHFLATWR